MDRLKLKRLIQQNESPKLDFKKSMDLSTESAKKELAKDVCAIANSAYGRGYMIFGIEDKTKRLTGIKTEDYIEEQIQQVLSQRIDPPVNTHLDVLHMDGVDLAVLTIYDSLRKPHQLRQTGAFYIRRGSTTDFARRDELANLLQHQGVIYNELIPLYPLTEADLDHEAVERFSIKAGFMPSDQDSLHRLGILSYDRINGFYTPTIGGVLLFGKDPQRYLPHTSIHIVNLLGIKKETYTIKGTLLEMLEKAVEVIELCIRYTPYPKGVYQEAIANALVHRDYFDSSRQITVFLTTKRMEISNPGASHDLEKPHSVSRERNPSRRNMWLYDKLMIMDDQKRFNESGLGFIRMKKALQNRGRIHVVNSTRNNLFKLIIALDRKTYESN